MSKQKTILEASKLPIMAAVQAIANEVKASLDDAEGDALEVYGEYYMENLSEAGYSETRPNDRLSIRAFARILRVESGDLSALKNTLGYRKGSVYHDFAISDVVISALSRNAELVPALKLLAPAEDEKAAGPFYPSRSNFDVAEALKSRDSIVKDVAGIVGKDPAVDTAAIKLAKVFKLTGTAQLASRLKKGGVMGEAFVAHAVLIALRNDARLVAGLRCAQPA